MKRLILIMVGVLIVFPAIARDFNYTYEGQTLTYTVIDEEAKTVETKAGYNGPGNNVCGSLSIPRIAYDGNKAYTVIRLGRNSFWKCRSLTSADIPNSVTEIGKMSFSECVGLSAINLPNSVKTIGEQAFDWCKSLTSVDIPDSVTEIGEQAFASCDNLDYINVGKNNVSYAESHGILYNKDFTELVCLPGARTELSIRGTVRTIGPYACYWNKNLTKLNLPNSVSYIGKCAFAYCDSLTSVNIPNSVIDIGELAFDGCSGLTSVNIPNSVINIGACAFSVCEKLEFIYVPESVIFIGQNAFTYCQSLKSISVDEANLNYADVDGVLYDKNITELICCPGGVSKLDIPNSVSKIRGFAVFCCFGLTRVDIPDSVTEIGEHAFTHCQGLTSITLGESVATIDSYAFENCENLISITLPESISFIDKKAFERCESLQSVYYKADIPVTSTTDIFSSSVYSQATLYVKDSTVKYCKRVQPWKNFVNIQSYDFSDVQEVEKDFQPAQKCEVFNLNGVRVGEKTEGLEKGIYIIHQNNSNRKISVR